MIVFVFVYIYIYIHICIYRERDSVCVCFNNCLHLSYIVDAARATNITPKNTADQDDQLDGGANDVEW